MASSRKPPPKSDRYEAALRQSLENCLGADWRHSRPTIAIAYSGGADSTLLLHSAASLASRREISVVALHIDHGLSPLAGDWSIHCAEQAKFLELAFDSQRVLISRAAGESLEAVARDARYRALFALCLKHQARVLLTAHNANDQAETVLLNLTRGAGIAGMAGIAPVRKVQELILGRPFLGFFAEDIRVEVKKRGIRSIEDESNLEHRFRRNALRHRIMPLLREVMPGAIENLGKAAQHASQAQELLDEIGRSDLLSLDVDDHGFALDGFVALSRLRATNALRVWFRQYRVHAPSAALLTEILDQLLGARSTGRLELRYLTDTLVVDRNRLVVSETPTTLACTPRILRWMGEPAVDLPDWGGRLVFEPTDDNGIPEDWLRGHALSLRGRQGGERLKLHDKRPSRTLKNLFQERKIPERLRDRLPLLFADDLLVFAAGLGTDIRAQIDHGSSPDALVKLRWEILGSDATAHDEIPN